MQSQPCKTAGNDTKLIQLHREQFNTKYIHACEKAWSSGKAVWPGDEKIYFAFVMKYYITCN